MPVGENSNRHFLLLPMLQRGQIPFQILPDLLRGLDFVCHMLRAEGNQGVQIGVCKLTVFIVLFAVVLIEAAVRLLTEDGILKGHAAALAHQLPGRTQKGVDGHVEQL